MRQSEFHWRNRKGLALYGQIWQPLNPPKAVIVLIHGIGEHSNRYQHWGKKFTTANIAVITCDHIGHGKSGGKRGHVEKWDDLLDEIDTLIQKAYEVFPGVPVFTYGHSLGGNLVLDHAVQRQPAIAGVVATSPGLAPTRVPLHKLISGKILYYLYPAFMMTNELDITGLSKDERVIQAYQNDPQVHNLVSVRLGLDLINSGKRLVTQTREFPLPLLLLHGTADRLVKFQATRDFAEKLDGKTQFFPIQGGYHELHNEPEKDEVFALIHDWLDSILKKPAD